MAVKTARKKSSSAAKPASSGGGNRKVGNKSVLIGIFMGAAALLLAIEAYNFFYNAPTVEAVISAQVVGQFSGSDQPCGKFGAWDVAAAGDDKIAVTDQQNGRILFFDRSGKFLKAWGKKGDGPEDLKEPSGIASGPKGDVYFVDAWKSVIIGLDSKFKPNLTVPLTHGFYGPRGVAYDGTSFYVADTGTHRVVKVSPQGDVVASWGTSKQGDGKNEFNNPRSLKVDSKGNVYVADFENSRVQVLDSTGKFLMAIKVGNKVTDVAVDPRGRIFAASMDGNFVKVFGPDGKSQGQLKAAPGSPDVFRSITGMGFTPDGVLLVAANDSVALVRVP